MKKNLKILLAVLLASVFSGNTRPMAQQAGKILCTTFPVYQITRNVIREIPGLEADLMIPAGLGCPHNYSLTPGDMRKAAAAEILVINGLGMEEFLGSPLHKANPDIRIVDSSLDIEGVLDYGGAPAAETEDHDGHRHEAGAEPGTPGHGDEPEHEHEGVNPHLFTSPLMAGRMAENIAEGLARHFPEKSEALRRNGRGYAENMNRLAREFSGLAARLENRRIVTQHGAFDYLARDAGLEVVGVINLHGGDSLSASGIIRLVRKIRSEGAGAVFTEPQYSDRIGKTIAAEAGIPSGQLDPAASGPENAPLDYYETVMRENMRVLEKLLGGGN